MVFLIGHARFRVVAAATLSVFFVPYLAARFSLIGKSITGIPSCLVGIVACLRFVVEHLKVFANQHAAQKWFRENDAEGVACEYEVIE